ncbi:heptaprenyl diphosphate synthase component II [Rummeliibacillus pycnus]|uniref:heptaprenyl diphosphate synthase component II n=1 Tax=Rummeliibacillus pycnus TaxID=101070 RepID=UPI001B8017B8|nr:heptaprenyl diphosphate synthase component II [Rummeliibacillus pycnus]
MEKMRLKLLYADLQSDIRIIEKELETALDSSSHYLKDASLHLLKAGGKRIRPVFVLLGAKFGRYDIQQIKHVAVPLELIHMASLVHDDVIDDSELRRGRPTVKSQWNNRVAMYAGDFIFSKALEYMTKIENQKAHEILSKTMVEICLGEIIQIEDKMYVDQNIRDYFRRIKRKTALLISSSCHLGAVAAGAEEQVANHLKRFGYYVGMSFQIIDDILDLTATDKQLGKPAGSDLMQGNITLPVLLVKEDSEIRTYIDKALDGTMKEDERQVFLKKIRKSSAIEESYRISNLYLQKALQEIDALPSNSVKKSLRDIALYMGKRKF